MKRLFVSQPMNGKTNEEILQERTVAVEKAKVILDDDVELIDSYIEEDAPEGYNPGLWYLAKSIELLAKADIVYFAKGWSKARGCIVEHECATRYGIECI